jgi:hypothetical protein
MMTARITTTLNLWRTRCEFLHGGSHSEKIAKQRRILLKQVEDLKTRGQNLGRKGMDHMSGAPAKAAQFRVIRAWIQTAQALFRQANKRQEHFLTHRITPYFRQIHHNG